MHSVTDCFHSNQPSLTGLFWYPRLGWETSLFPHVNNGKSDLFFKTIYHLFMRNLSVAKHGDLRDKTPSPQSKNIFPLRPSLSARAIFFPYPVLPPTLNTLRSLCNEESGGSERGVRNEEHIHSL
ncbi:hypothetical protein AVEN_1701-1 [Araneus ventricosus]|uniref:Uncharacterized protein n=1 Tax=Araneus ventricosus TaxID=182803 RepID=A0A4Y2WX96_ARAVE|nr:hypothetical protein AVEN_1701-1 [Araneus ventricosus]